MLLWHADAAALCGQAGLKRGFPELLESLHPCPAAAQIKGQGGVPFQLEPEATGQLRKQHVSKDLRCIPLSCRLASVQTK